MTRHVEEAAATSGTATPVECDLLVVGSGAGGLSAAVTAAAHGLHVVVAEKEPVLGGTTAWSGGWMWLPRNPLARRAGIDEPVEAPREYLRGVLGNNFDAARVDAFLEAAPRMVEFFESRTALRFEANNRIPDTYGNIPGAGTGGRSLIAAPYDARALGPLVRRLRRPLRETTFLGMTIQAGPDLAAFMNVTRSPRAFLHVTRRLGQHLLDLARHGRGMQLRNGIALVGRLLRSAAELGVDLRTDAPALRLLREEGRVCGAVLGSPAGEVEVRARRGVVLAAGGYPHDLARRQATFPAGGENWTVAAPAATGDGLRLGEAVGGTVDASLAAPGAWCPVSLVPYADGSTGRFPHIIERGKPGIIGVLSDGRRFCNEGGGYHDYVAALLRAVRPGQEVASWLICTRAFQRRYGLGIARPAPLPVRPHLRSGYIRSGRTVAELARACGIDPDGLERTLAEYNRHARRGEDPAFGRGSTPYNRLQGDADHGGPNPCVAPIEDGPFFAVKVLPGSFGTFAGLKTDACARVLDAGGAPIPGLYAAGTDMASVMGGHYPAGGINLGPAMTFGFIAGRHAAAGPG
ncbi:FAD-dependent oxidoreductase [Roseomonas sp. OT10]|uniref:FAD-dependent oxidoreductase n=1 Tax=Roseomonas cutis TaxID=2897332 RepID=UPI001E475327|nr:FAD-dependent oxidoreductase [Roseomonas sp. OT10]UFN47677.1 FAD-dependent oxidoreductase [Roseomonas sp. OT10]